MIMKTIIYAEVEYIHTIHMPRHPYCKNFVQSIDILKYIQKMIRALVTI